MYNDYNISDYNSPSLFWQEHNINVVGVWLRRHALVDRNTVSGSSKTKGAPNQVILIREPQLFIDRNRENAMLCTWKRPRLGPIRIHAGRQWAMILPIDR